MSDFPSLANLSPKASQKSGRASLKISSSEVEEKFAKKMKAVGLQEKEIETMRRASTVGYPHIDLERFPIASQALRVVAKEDAERVQAVCFYYAQDEFRLGAVTPEDPAVQELLFQIQERTQAHGMVYSISEKSFARVLKLYETLPIVKPIVKDIEIHVEELEQVQASVTDFRQLQDLLVRKSTTDILVFVLGASLKLDASDVHIEAEEKGIIVRFRLDGILHDAVTLPKDAFKQLVSRVKLVSGLKINITDKPQDGRFSIKPPSGEVDVRVSTVPTVYGESLVMRLLHQNREGLTLEKIGLYGDAFERLKQEITRPNGMIVTTGPTGSGKTTTLYAIMTLLNEPGVKIITLEDPVEYKMEGVNQSQIDPSKGYTFAKALRSVLRQDPDIAMVGEIRDLETADVAIQAALTGHLMLSTIHTNSAAGAVPRFLSMGVKPFLLAPALNCVIGQRLVRRLCEKCKQPAALTADEAVRVEKVMGSLPEQTKAKLGNKALEFFSAPGCEACNGIGYKGRIGIYEVFVMIKEIEERILAGQISEYTIEEEALKHGMITMVQDGLLKALDGVTSVDEVFRVTE